MAMRESLFSYRSAHLVAARDRTLDQGPGFTADDARDEAIEARVDEIIEDDSLLWGAIDGAEFPFTSKAAAAIAKAAREIHTQCAKHPYVPLSAAQWAVLAVIEVLHDSIQRAATNSVDNPY